ncbi:MAG: diguanylate cyclase [Nitrospirota bacterium]|nr:MAG: diguanylate cyclase [Nitrospirota bacterium]
MRLSSIKHKFLLVTIGTMLLFGSLLIILLKNTLHEKLVHEIQKKGLFMSNHLTDMTEKLILTENNILLYSMIYEFLKTDSDIIYIFVEDDKNNIIAHTFGDEFPTDLLAIHIPPDINRSSIMHIGTKDGNIIDFARPILEGDAGFTHIGISEQSMLMSIENITNAVLIMITIALLLACIFTVLLINRIIRPLPELAKAARKIGGGDLSVGVEVMTKDEIGELAETFNSMTKGLKRSRDELVNANEWLEEEIRERRITERTLGRSLTFLNSIFDSIRDPFIIIDKRFRIIMVNDEYSEMKGMTSGELTGQTCYKIMYEQDQICDECVVSKTFDSGDPCVKEKEVILPDGSTAWLELYTYPVIDDDGKVTHVIEYTRNVTDRKRSEAEKKELITRLEELSMEDDLTGLLNRRALMDILDLNLQTSRRYEHELSLMICDLDNLKTINDNYGHIAGDLTIREASKVLKSSLRASDVIGRYGGDEFMVILPETGIKGAEDLAERIRLEMQRATIILKDGTEINTTVSIGVAARNDIESPDELMSMADEAMYVSKRTGRNRSFTFGT